MGSDVSYDRDFLGATTGSPPRGPGTYPLLWASVSVNGNAHCSAIPFQLLEIARASHRGRAEAGAVTGGSPVPPTHSLLGGQS